MPIKALIKHLRRTFLLCAALSFSSPLFALNLSTCSDTDFLSVCNAQKSMIELIASSFDVTGRGERPVSYEIDSNYFDLVAKPYAGYHLAQWVVGRVHSNTNKGTRYYNDNSLHLITKADKKENEGYLFQTLKIYYDYEPNTNTVELVSGLENKPSKSYTLRYNEKLVLAGDAFYNIGYSLAKWIGKNKEEYEVGETYVNRMPEHGQKLVLTAQWTNNVYTVKFDTRSPIKIGQIKVNFDEGYNSYGHFPEKPAIPGNTFRGWSIDPNATIGNINGDSPVETPYDHTLYAIWEKNPITVKFDAKGGSPTPSDIVVYIDETYVGIPSGVTRAGYIFDGWYTDDGIKVEEGDTVTLAVNHTLSAHWKADSVSVTFGSDDSGAVVDIPAKDYSHDEPYGELPTPTCEYFTFLGWYLDGVLVDASKTLVPNKPHTLVAHWQPDTYNVNFDKNSVTALATLAPVSPRCCDEYRLPDFIIENAALPNPTYRFVGWTLDPQDVLSVLKPGDTFSDFVKDETYTFYAIWTPYTNDLSVAAHCKRCEVVSDKWEVVPESPTSIRSKISAIIVGNNSLGKELSLPLRGDGKLSFKAKSSVDVAPTLKFWLTDGSSNQTNLTASVSSDSWTTFEFSYKDLSKDLSFQIHYVGEQTSPDFSEQDEDCFYLDEIVWTPEGGEDNPPGGGGDNPPGGEDQPVVPTYSITVETEGFSEWFSDPVATNGVITVISNATVKVWGKPKSGYESKYTSEETAYSIGQVVKDETLKFAATKKAVVLSQLAKDANCVDIDIENGVGSIGSWEKAPESGIWCMGDKNNEDHLYNQTYLTAVTFGKGTLSFDFWCSPEMSDEYIRLDIKVNDGGWTNLAKAGNFPTEVTHCSTNLTEDAIITWRVDVSTDANNGYGFLYVDEEDYDHFYLNNIKWEVEGDSPGGGGGEGGDPNPPLPKPKDFQFVDGQFNVTNVYDGAEHTLDTAAIEAAVKAVASDATIQYSDNAATGWGVNPPTSKNVPGKNVYYKFSAKGYNDFIGSSVVTILPRAITIKANDVTWKIDGGEEAPTEFSYSITSGALVEGDALVGSLVCDYEREAGKSYPIEAGDLTSEHNPNYSITIVPGTLKIVGYSEELPGLEKDYGEEVVEGYAGFVLGKEIEPLDFSFAIGWKVAGLPTGLKFNAKTGFITGKPTKSGSFTVTFAKTANKQTTKVTTTFLVMSKEDDLRAISFEIDDMKPTVDSATDEFAAITLPVGVFVNWPIEATSLSTATVKVAGLPTGLKLVQDKTTKLYSIQGTPTAASKVDKKTGAIIPSLAKFTVTTAGKNSRVYTMSITAEAMRSWAVGTFNGGSYFGEAPAGLATITTSATGKISGKILTDGKTWTLSATSFDTKKDEVYTATLTAKSGKEIQELTIKLDKFGIVGDGIVAYQNLWKTDWKVFGKTLAADSIIKKTGLPLPTDFVFPANDDMAMTSLTLKFAASGAVTATTIYDMGVDAKGKQILYKASSTTVLIPREDDTYLVYVYFAPNKTKSFPGFSALIPLTLTL